MSKEYWDEFLGLETGAIDPQIERIINLEEERQARKLIMIPSESMAPRAVRAALGSVFNNVYAEGYPPLRMTRDAEELLLDEAYLLAYYLPTLAIYGLGVLGSRHRLRILGALAGGGATYRGLVKTTGLAAGPLYHHVNQLRLAGLVRPKERDLYEITPKGTRCLLMAAAGGRMR